MCGIWSFNLIWWHEKTLNDETLIDSIGVPMKTDFRSLGKEERRQNSQSGFLSDSLRTYFSFAIYISMIYTNRVIYINISHISHIYHLSQVFSDLVLLSLIVSALNTVNMGNMGNIVDMVFTVLFTTFVLLMQITKI